MLSQFAQKHNAAVPVQYLRNDKDNGSCIVSLNLAGNTLQLISRSSLRKQKHVSSKVKMNTDTYLGMPAVETTIVIESGTKPMTLKGNFNIDFGNPELLFLLEQSNDVQQFFAENSDTAIFNFDNNLMYVL